MMRTGLPIFQRLGRQVSVSSIPALTRVAGARAFSSSGSSMDYSPPRSWTPMPIVTETVVCPTLQVIANFFANVYAT